MHEPCTNHHQRNNHLYSEFHSNVCAESSTNLTVFVALKLVLRQMPSSKGVLNEPAYAGGRV
jgi:hypothetical protein